MNDANPETMRWIYHFVAKDWKISNGLAARKHYRKIKRTSGKKSQMLSFTR
jgi:hypothetical protein